MGFREKPIDRPDLFECYIKNVTEFIKLHRPDVSDEKIIAWVKDKVAKRCELLIDNLNNAVRNNEELDVYRDHEHALWPTVQMIRASDSNNPKSSAHVYGDFIELDSMDLYRLTRKYKNKIISPFGVGYETADKCSSFLKGLIGVKKKSRKKEKKLMLEAKKNCDKTAEVFHNNNQATIKINMNSMIGAMGSGFSNLSSVANFNSVTSICRFFIMNSYAHAERFLESNFYFRNDEQCIEFIMSCCMCGPSDDRIRTCMDNMGFKYPEYSDVCDFLVGSVHRYDTLSDHEIVKRTLRRLTKERLCFIYYMSNMKHLVFDNESFWRPWIDDLLSDNNVTYSKDIQADYLFKIDGDLGIVLSTVYNKLLPKNSKGNNISIYECVEADPVLAQRLACCGKHMEELVSKTTDIFDLFMNHSVNISHVVEHKNQYRDAVVVSDTDSIIFTTKSWLEWYNGDIIMTDRAYNINALVVYWLGKANYHILYHVSEAFGAIGEDLIGMNMKNEFMMPVEILTSLKKHYASILKIQEGVFYSEPRLDMKGVGLRGSVYGASVLNYTEWFVRSSIDEIYNKAVIDTEAKIVDVLRFERLVRDSLYNGKPEFLPITAIKNKEEYAKPEVSVYFNYEVWQSVFGDKYGMIQIPTKCYMVPLTGMNSVGYRQWLTEKYPVISQKLEKFIADHPNKDINRIPINPSSPIIPEELRPIVDYGNLVYANTRPMYIIMQALGLSTGDADKDLTFSGMYGWVTEEEGKKALEHTK